MTDERDKAAQGWAKLLNPAELRSNLVRASVFLTAYEFLSQALIEHLEGFFADDFDANGPIVGEEYRSKVLSLHKMPFFASAIWFRDSGALTDRDLDNIREIREHRNFVSRSFWVALSRTFARTCCARLLRSSGRSTFGGFARWTFRPIQISTPPR